MYSVIFQVLLVVIEILSVRIGIAQTGTYASLPSTSYV